jgi:hypothetical protein
MQRPDCDNNGIFFNTDHVDAVTILLQKSWKLAPWNLRLVGPKRKFCLDFLHGFIQNFYMVLSRVSHFFNQISYTDYKLVICCESSF